MSNLAAAFATSVAAVFLVVLGLTFLTALFGSQQIEAPLLYTILITHAATLVVAWITASVSDVASASAAAPANQQRGVAAFVFTNAAGAVVTLATNGMESWELGCQTGSDPELACSDGSCLSTPQCRISLAHGTNRP